MKLSITASLLAFATVALSLPVAEPGTSTNAAHQLFARANCLPTGDNGLGCPVQDANACADYLIGLGATACVLNNARYTENCHKGSCYVWGRPLPVGSTYASSYCRDVGYGLRSIIDSCSNNGYVAGSGTAGGNGNYGIVLENGNPN